MMDRDRRNVTAEGGSVSVIIASFNGASTLPETIESCLSQTLRPHEVIVVDDGSTDSTPQVLAEFGERITVIRQPNGGLASARNAGVRAATGELVAWLDADDIAAPQRLRVQAAVLCSNPGIGLVSSDFSAFRVSGPDMASSYIDTYYDAAARLGGAHHLYPEVLACPGLRDEEGHPYSVRRGAVYETLLWGNFVHPPTIMARRSLHLRAGEFDETLRYSSDYDLIVRMARLADYAYVDAPLLRYRLSAQQLSNSAQSGKMQLETVRVLDKIAAADPSLHVRQRSLFERRKAESLLSAAASIGSADRASAMALFREGWRHCALPKAAFHAAVRIALPLPMLKSLSALRRRGA